MEYKKFIDLLFENQDLKYREFNSSLIIGSKYEMIGVRTPILRKIAKQFDLSILSKMKYVYYEEVIVAGFIIDSAKISYDEKIVYVKEHLKYIDNWGSCDMFPVKFVSNNKELFFKEIEKYIISENVWEIRFALVVLLGYYITDDYIDRVLEFSNNITSDFYYVKMANAWLISMCFVKYRDKTLDFFNYTKVDFSTITMAIRKCKDSFRINAEDKEVLSRFLTDKQKKS